MTVHQEPHPQAGQTVKVAAAGLAEGELIEYRLEDWWDRIAGKSWGDCNGNPAAMIYGLRAGQVGLPPDDEVVYGKVGSFGHLVHVTEIQTAP